MATQSSVRKGRNSSVEQSTSVRLSIFINFIDSATFFMTLLMSCTLHVDGTQIPNEYEKLFKVVFRFCKKLINFHCLKSHPLITDGRKLFLSSIFDGAKICPSCAIKTEWEVDFERFINNVVSDPFFFNFDKILIQECAQFLLLKIP